MFPRDFNFYIEHLLPIKNQAIRLFTPRYTHRLSPISPLDRGPTAITAIQFFALLVIHDILCAQLLLTLLVFIINIFINSYF